MNSKQQKAFLEAIKNSIMSDRAKDFVLYTWSLYDVKPVKENKVRNTKSKQAVLLDEWEKAHGNKLCLNMFYGWVKSNGYSEQVVSRLIDEFRIEMVSKAKRYADFRAAFQVYLLKGYLSVKPDNPIIKKKTLDDVGTTVTRRGVNL